VTEDTYPHHWAGDEADPPAPAAPRIVEMARRAQARLLATPDPLAAQRTAAPAGRLAHALEILGAEADTANPTRDRSSDGTWGDARHQAEGNASDHNGWLKGRRRADLPGRDIDTDGLDLFTPPSNAAGSWPPPASFPRSPTAATSSCQAASPRQTSAAGGCTPGRIRTSSKATSRCPACRPSSTCARPGACSCPLPRRSRRSRRHPGSGPAQTCAAPARCCVVRPARTGRACSGCRRPAGGPLPRLPARRRQPGRRRLVGDVTGRWLDEFGRRSGVPQADGRNIGPRLALALYRAGIRP
jgi:hypothetical protein